MNVMALYSRTAQNSIRASVTSRAQADRGVATSVALQVQAAVAKLRKQWLNALMVDETRAWLSMQEQQPEVFHGAINTLALVALAKEYEDHQLNSPDARVIRGAISAAQQALTAGGIVTEDMAQALSSAAKTARLIAAECSDAAICHAAERAHHHVTQGGH